MLLGSRRSGTICGLHIRRIQSGTRTKNWYKGMIARPKGRIIRKSFAIPMATVISAFLIDAASKNWAENHLASGRTITQLSGVIKLKLLYNQGATMGFGSSRPVAISVFVIIGTAAVLGWALLSKFIPIQIFAGLAAGGSLGNLADRLFRKPGPLRGPVIDWISFSGQSGVFNVADVFIRLGLLVAVIFLIFHDRRDVNLVDKTMEDSKN